MVAGALAESQFGSGRRRRRRSTGAIHSRVLAGLCTNMHEVSFSPFLAASLSIKTKTNRLVILGAVEGILGELRLLVAILALAGLALAGALFAGLLPGKTRAAVF